jgi:signal transduction histidine kinase
MGLLRDFLTKEREHILTAAKKKAMESRWARISSGALEHGWGEFYDDLTSRLGADDSPVERGAAVASKEDPRSSDSKASAESAAAISIKRGKDFLHLGYAISEVVQSYSIIYQAITESAWSLKVDITPEEFQKLNVSLDTAVSEVVRQFESAETKTHEMESDAKDAQENQRLSSLAHELRNSLQGATVTLEMIEDGVVDAKSETAKILHNSLERMANLIDRALAEARMHVEPKAHLKSVRISDVLKEVGVTAGFQARARQLGLQMQEVGDLNVLVDRHLLISALSNLVQNALKFTKPDGNVHVRARVEDQRILIEVEDECGGLPDGKIEELFEPGVQKSLDQSGMGLGLTISRQAIERNNGELRAANLPGKGCIFTIDLPSFNEALQESSATDESPTHVQEDASIQAAGKLK